MIASEPRTVQTAFLESLTRAEVRALPYLFEFWALPHQLPPEGDWKTWLILGGRGAGKTRAGAEWVRMQVEGSGPMDPGRCTRIALIGETYDQARDIMVFGDSGIMACTPPDRTPMWEAGRRRLIWPNGAEAKVFSAHDYEALRGPQFDGAWVDEIGCAAIDKGTNQPNKFLDPKSSESSLPKYSNGARDDLIQLHYLKALRRFWTDPENNPVSDVYDAAMLDVSRMFVWAWDARPYPYFPGNTDVWSDGGNYTTGHWLTGRVSARSLAAVVSEICSKSGVEDIHTDRLYGLVRGLSLSGDEDARAALQPLMLAYGLDAFEADGRLTFASRENRARRDLSDADLARGDGEPLVSRVRTPEAEIAGRLRLYYLDADSDYEVRAVESIFPDEGTTAIDGSEVPLALTASEAQGTVERWLSEARVARDSVAFSLPPSSELSVGDIVDLAVDDTNGRYRIDRIEDGGRKRAEAVRVDPAVVGTTLVDVAASKPRVPTVPLPVWSTMMDLPLLQSDDAPAAPWIAATSDPWTGPVAVYSSLDGAGSWRFVDELSQPALMGRTLNDLRHATPGLWDRGDALEVRFPRGALSSVEERAVFAGGNAAAIGDGSGNWEVFQFRDAVLSEDGTWHLSHRLRGQRGTDGLMPEVWPSGSTVVVLDESLKQVPMPDELRGLPLRYRVGPASKSADHSSFVEFEHSAGAIGLRPYRPAHLKSSLSADGAVTVTWKRRTRVVGDTWALAEVPLGEASEAYLVRVLVSGVLRRETQLSQTSWTYTSDMRVEDSLTGAFDVEVAQISDLYGPGPFARMMING